MSILQCLLDRKSACYVKHADRTSQRLGYCGLKHQYHGNRLVRPVFSVTRSERLQRVRKWNHLDSLMYDLGCDRQLHG